MIMINYNTDTDVNETVFEDLKEYQEITDPKLVQELVGSPVILDHYTGPEEFDRLFNHTIDVAALCWGNVDDKGTKLQRTPILFKVNSDEKTTRILPLNKFMISLAFLRCIIRYIDNLNVDDFIITGQYLTEKDREAIHNRTAKTLMQYSHTTKEIEKIIAQCALDLKMLNNVFSYADMMVFDADNLFLDHYKASEVIREINNTEYPPTAQTAEIVAENARKCKILIAEMTRLNNPLFRANKYVKIIKDKQLEELLINFSQIPDGENIIPVIMNGNGFKAGYHDMPVLYAAAIAARVPDMMNGKYMGKTGYFGRNMWILDYGTISRTVYDCGSKNLLPVTIDEVELEMKEGRFYSEDPSGDVLKVLKRTDKHLIGRRLFFRSPCTCNLLEDCCHTCYGTIALKVGELPGGFIYTTEIMTGIIGQRILSAKHLLKTDSEPVEMTDNFNDWFTFVNSSIVPNDAKRFDIFIKDDYADNLSENITFYIGKDLKPVTIGHYANAYIPDELLKDMKDVYIGEDLYHKISSYKVLDAGIPLCEITPINIMMTAKYFNLNRLFESNMSKYTSFEEVVSTLTHLLHKTIPILSVHGEIIIGHLARRPDNKLLRPNWLNENEPYQLLNLKDALRNTESITQALAFENTRHHLLYPIFDERNKINRVGPISFIDYLFGSEVL